MPLPPFHMRASVPDIAIEYRDDEERADILDFVRGYDTHDDPQAVVVDCPTAEIPQLIGRLKLLREQLQMRYKARVAHREAIAEIQRHDEDADPSSPRRLFGNLMWTINHKMSFASEQERGTPEGYQRLRRAQHDSWFLIQAFIYEYFDLFNDYEDAVVDFAEVIGSYVDEVQAGWEVMTGGDRLKPIPKPGPPKREILLTGAIGDIFAVESFFPDDLRDNLGVIYWATERGTHTIDLFRKIPRYRDVHHVVLTTEGIYRSKEEVTMATGHSLQGVEDWSIDRIFPRVNARKLDYNGSSFLDADAKLGDIWGLELPDRFMVIQGCTPSNGDYARSIRDLMPGEWSAIVYRLRAMGLRGVVLDLPGEPLPPDSGSTLIDHRGLGLGQSIEILKHPNCVGYLGIDSCLAALACRRFDPYVEHYLMVRTKNLQYKMNALPYAGVHPDYNFIVDQIRR